MALADQIVQLRDAVLAELDAVRDYYANTRTAWRFVQYYVERGETAGFQTATEGDALSERDITEKADYYVAKYLTASTFQQFVSLFEDFLFGVMRQWLMAYPQRLARKQIPFSLVLDATELNDLRLAAVDRELNELNYKKLREWFAYLDDMVRLGCPTADEIDRLAEIKATRDIVVHNRGLANRTYEDKAGAKKRCNAGERLDIAEQYHRDSWQLIKKVVADVSAAVLTKA